MKYLYYTQNPFLKMPIGVEIATKVSKAAAKEAIGRRQEEGGQEDGLRDVLA
jgi:hypothetical protein